MRSTPSRTSIRTWAGSSRSFTALNWSRTWSEQGKVKLTEPVDVDLAYHDPCYLGRTNGEYDAPRFLLKAVPGIQVREAELSREHSMCCGAGGGRMWLEEKLGRAHQPDPLRPARGHRDHNVAVACPYCCSMLSDAQNELGHEQARSWDVIELVARAIPES